MPSICIGPISCQKWSRFVEILLGFNLPSPAEKRPCKHISLITLHSGIDEFSLIIQCPWPIPTNLQLAPLSISVLLYIDPNCVAESKSNSHAVPSLGIRFSGKVTPSSHQPRLSPPSPGPDFPPRAGPQDRPPTPDPKSAMLCNPTSSFL